MPFTVVKVKEAFFRESKADLWKFDEIVIWCSNFVSFIFLYFP